MKIYLNVFDYPLGDEVLSTLKAKGWDGLRRDLKALEQVEGMLAEGKAFNLDTILLLNEAPEACPELARALSSIPGLDCMVEVGNEWDRTYGPTTAKASWDACLPFLGERMITGGITSLSQTALSWASKALRLSFPNVGFHPYRTTKPPTAEIMEDIERLRSLCPMSRLWNTECGWHTAKSKISCFKSVQFSDTQVAAFLDEDIWYHKAAKVETYTVYQLNDGPNPSYYEDCFGIRRLDGTWKPSSDTPLTFGGYFEDF